MGKDSGSNSASNPSADLLAQIAKDLYNQTNPLRSNLINRYTAMTSAGGLTPQEQQELSTLQGIRSSPITPTPTRYLPDYSYNPDPMAWGPDNNNLQLHGIPVYDQQPQGLTDAQQARLSFLEGRQNAPATPGTDLTSQVNSSPQFASLKDAIDRQFAMAKNNALATTPAGGALTRSLTNLEGTRASSMAAGFGDLANQEMSRAFSLATGTAPQAMSGLGSSAAIQAQLEAANSARESAAKQGLGRGIGSAVALAAMK